MKKKSKLIITAAALGALVATLAKDKKKSNKRYKKINFTRLT
ncbi:hypothetical protein SAMN04487885_110116 [Clostridium cadaveris]|uniref:Uncharacterized protein n=1 Tax=Clostridium cadaveris TaxID=1529 RepID=A0A1I2LL58_9CLOT|nr:hypothetical protein [Clostridium cadaveris]MDM8310712.1 hypothetical protein [Clostridium cadaveris]SFF79190.1 hypothetical protein SAMN04487885_110116 [Clostridium cadaveris]